MSSIVLAAAVTFRGLNVSIITANSSVFFFPKPTEVSKESFSSSKSISNTINEELVLEPSLIVPSLATLPKEDLAVLTIQNDLFKTTVSNERLGTFLTYSLATNESQHKGAFVKTSSDIEENKYIFNPDAPVEFLFGKEEGFESCNPCIEDFYPTNVSIYINSAPLGLERAFNVTDTMILRFVDNDSGAFHELIFLPDSYKIEHNYGFKNESNITLLWKNGIRPSEKHYWLDDQMSYAMYVGDDGNDYDWLTGPLEKDALRYNNQLTWVGLRNKFSSCARRTRNPDRTRSTPPSSARKI